MLVYDINNDLTQVNTYSVRSVTEKINNSTGSKNDPTLKNNPTTVSKDQKQNLVSEKLDSQVADQPAGLRFQEDTPVAKLLESLKTFNESQRIKAEQDSATNSAKASESAAANSSIHEDAPVGYYIVIDEKTKSKNKKLLRSRFDLVKEKISKTYNLGFKKENGALVNLSA